MAYDLGFTADSNCASRLAHGRITPHRRAWPRRAEVVVVQVLEDNARLKAEVAALRDENARLKGLKGRPKIAPSGMEKATQPGATTKGQRKIGRRGSMRTKLTITETETVRCESLPTGSRLKGYEDFIVQDLIVQSKTVLYRRERWLLPSGEGFSAHRTGLSAPCRVFFAN